MIRPETRMTKSSLAEFSKRITEQLGEKVSTKKPKHLEAEAWEDFLDMAVGQASLWAASDEGKSKWKFILRDKRGTNKSEPKEI
jgi:adenylylsulfate reductase subunit A